MRILLLLSGLLLTSILHAQKNGELNGILVDAERKTLSKATVTILLEKDSTILSYTMTNDNGKFSFVKLPVNQDLLLNIAHININTYEKSIRLKDNEKLELDTIQLDGLSIEEVVVSRQPPIQLKGDTLEYKADYFKTRPNASVEELLQLLPGLQVNVDGSIYYQGRKVSGIRVNNKDFFAEDPTIATKNLDASLIEAVQVIKDKGESKREILDDTNLPIVINLKTKREFLKANFGKFYGGGGTRDRYESGALINTFRDTLQISFIGFANNISREGFDYSELRQYGGYDRAENNSMGYYSYGGLENKISVGINTNYDIGKILKTNLMYNYDNRKSYNEGWSESQSFYEDVLELGDNKHTSRYKNGNHKVRAFVRYAPDTTFRTSMDINVNLSNSRNSYNNLSNSIRNTHDSVRYANSNNHNNNRNPQYQHNFQIEKKLTSNKWLFSLSHQLSRNTNSGISEAYGYNRFYLFNDSIVDQTTVENNSGRNLSVNNRFNVQIPIKKGFNLDVFAAYNWQKERNLESIDTRINSDVFTNRDDIGDDKEQIIANRTVGTKLNARLFKKLNATAEIQHLGLHRDYHYFGKNENINTRDQYWLPSASLNYEGITIGYNKEVQNPYIYYLVGVNSDLYPTSLRIASPYFDNTITHSFSLQYFKNFTKSKINLNAYFRYGKSNNSISYANTYDTETTFSTSYNYQTGATHDVYGNMSIGKTFVQNKTWNISWRTFGYLGRNQSYSQVNGEENLNTSQYGNLENSFTFSYKNKYFILPVYSMRINSSNYQYESQNFRNVENFAHTFGTGIRVEGVKKFRLEASYNIRNQARNMSNARTNLHLINASLYYPIMNNKGEVKLSAFDILNQNNNIYYSSYGNNIYYSENLTLRQYFMLGIVMKFLSTSSK